MADSPESITPTPMPRPSGAVRRSPPSGSPSVSARCDSAGPMSTIGSLATGESSDTLNTPGRRTTSASCTTGSSTVSASISVCCAITRPPSAVTSRSTGESAPRSVRTITRVVPREERAQQVRERLVEKPAQELTGPVWAGRTAVNAAASISTAIGRRTMVACSGEP